MYKLFIADDEAIIREGLRCLLDWETLGFTIAGEAANGDAALQFLLSETPDLVLLDIRMPGMSGLDVVRIAREHGYDGKVVILSGYSDFNYARTAIRYGVLSYLTKPIDEDELLEIVTQIRNQLDSDASARDSSAHYRQKAYDSIIRDLLAGTAAYDRLDRAELHLNADVYQVIIYEKYSHRTEDASYRFSDLLRVTNQDHNSFDHITDDSREIILLKGSFATEKFGSFLERFQRQYQPQKDSPLDSLFLAYGRPVSHLEEIALSYTDASRLIDQRFFCEEDQHTLGYESLPTLGSGLPLIPVPFWMNMRTAFLTGSPHSVEAALQRFWANCRQSCINRPIPLIPSSCFLQICIFRSRSASAALTPASIFLFRETEKSYASSPKNIICMKSSAF